MDQARAKALGDAVAAVVAAARQGRDGRALVEGAEVSCGSSADAARRLDAQLWERIEATREPVS